MRENQGWKARQFGVGYACACVCVVSVVENTDKKSVSKNEMCLIEAWARHK
jgi:hypothetical protein